MVVLPLTDEAGNALFTTIYGIWPFATESAGVLTWADVTIAPDKKSVSITVKRSAGIAVALLSLTLLGLPANASGVTVKALVCGE